MVRAAWVVVGSIWFSLVLCWIVHFTATTISDLFKRYWAAKTTHFILYEKALKELHGDKGDENGR